MLAELYKQVGLHKRAEGELERALAANPKNEEHVRAPQSEGDQKPEILNSRNRFHILCR